MLTEDQIAEIKKRADEATEGDWRVCSGYTRTEIPVRRFSVAAFVGISEIGRDVVPDGVSEPDAKFIAAARTDIPLLLAEIKRLTSDRDGYKSLFERYDAQSFEDLIKSKGEALAEAERLRGELRQAKGLDNAAVEEIAEMLRRHHSEADVEQLREALSAPAARPETSVEPCPAVSEGRDIHEAIAAWHDHVDDGKTQLHEFLGMTWDQYKRWAEKGVLPEDSRFACAVLAPIGTSRCLFAAGHGLVLGQDKSWDHGNPDRDAWWTGDGPRAGITDQIVLSDVDYAEALAAGEIHERPGACPRCGGLDGMHVLRNCAEAR